MKIVPCNHHPTFEESYEYRGNEWEADGSRPVSLTMGDQSIPAHVEGHHSKCQCTNCAALREAVDRGNCICPTCVAHRQEREELYERVMQDLKDPELWPPFDP